MMQIRYDSCCVSESALNEAQVISLSPSSHRGYELRHIALNGLGRHEEEVEAFGVMLSILKRSPDADVRSTSFP